MSQTRIPLHTPFGVEASHRPPDGEDTRGPRLKTLLRGAFLGALMIVPSIGWGQKLTLNQAVNAQLEQYPDTIFQPCGRLVGVAGDTSALVGDLRAICDRSSTSGSGSSSATGGAQGTAVSKPTAVKARLEEAKEGEDDKNKSSSKARGADEEAIAVTELSRRLSLFVSARAGRLDRNVTTFEDGYESDISNATIGLDYQFTPKILAGFALDYYQQKGDYTSGGDFTVKTLDFLGYASFLPTERIFVQVTADYGNQNHDRLRPASFSAENGTVYTGSPNADFDAKVSGVGLLSGYDVYMGRLTVIPQLGLDFVNTDYGTYSETSGNGLALTFHDDEQQSLQTRLGTQVSIALSTKFGVILPQFGGYWVHEFLNNQRYVEVSFVEDTLGRRFLYSTDPPDRDFFEYNAGVVFSLKRGIQVFADLWTLQGQSYYESDTVTIGARFPLGGKATTPPTTIVE